MFSSSFRLNWLNAIIHRARKAGRFPIEKTASFAAGPRPIHVEDSETIDGKKMSQRRPAENKKANWRRKVCRAKPVLNHLARGEGRGEKLRFAKIRLGQQQPIGEGGLAIARGNGQAWILGGLFAAGLFLRGRGRWLGTANAQRVGQNSDHQHTQQSMNPSSHGGGKLLKYAPNVKLRRWSFGPKTRFLPGFWV